MKQFMQLVTGALFLLITGGVLAACAGSNETEDSVSDDEAAAVVPVNVKTLVIAPESFNETIEAVGVVKPLEEIMIASEEGGKVSRWYVRKGAYVSAGRNLVKLNDDLLQAQLQAAEAQMKIASVNAEKQAEVYADAGAVSELSVTTSQYNYEAAEAQVNLLQTRIAKTLISAPVAGVIEERLVDIGEMVAPGAPVARLIQTGVVKVVVGIPENYVDELRVGMPVEIRFDALDGATVRASVSYIGKSIDKNDRTIPVEIQLRNPGNRYAPEMIANVRLLKDVRRNAVVVPRTALVRVEDGHQIYLAVPTPDGEGYVVEARSVQIGPADRGNVIITSGVSPGERVITIGQSKVSPGEPIEFSE